MKRLLIIAVLVSILANVFLLYCVFDLGVTITYGADEISHLNQQMADAQKLLPLLTPNISRTDLLNAAEKAGIEVIDKRDEGLYVGSVRSIVSEDRVTAIAFD